MIIVSQDQCNVVNFANVINIGIEEKSTLTEIVQIVAETNGHSVTLGKYENEVRAQEVLQDLLQKLNGQKYLLKPRKKIDNATILEAKKYFEKINNIDLIVDDQNFEIISTGNNRTIIYQMPEK